MQSHRKIIYNIPSSIVFLDIDGVLITKESLKRDKVNNLFCPNCVNNLKTLSKETGCMYVVSSTWRYNPKLLITIFNNLGLIPYLFNIDTVSWKTPILKNSIKDDRPIEIDKWQSLYSDIIKETINDNPKYLIIDDTEFSWVNGQQNYVVQTTMDTGFDDVALFKATNILNK